MKKFITKIPQDFMAKSGEVFYSGGRAFRGKKRYYLLGFNPGGSPADPRLNTIADNVRIYGSHDHESHSSYLDDSWNRPGPGQTRMQRGLKHVADRVGMDLRDTPSSNLIFLRSPSKAQLPLQASIGVDTFWPFHELVIRSLGVEVIVAMGQETAHHIVKKLGGELERSGAEKNNRKWRMDVYGTPCGLRVVALPHPSRSAWFTPACDPSELILWASSVAA